MIKNISIILLFTLIYFAYCSEHELDKKSTSSIEFFNHTSLSEKCSKDDQKLLTKRSSSNDIMCIPRPTIVYLETMHGDITLVKKAVSVMRCDGFCNHGRKCFPTETTIIKKPMMYWKILSGEGVKCNYINIEEHVKCSCNCEVKRNDCSVNQIYDSRNCMCICDNMDEMIKCEEKQGWNWDHKTCTCRCKNISDCSTGFDWIPSRCGCGKVMMMEETNKPEVSMEETAMNIL